MNQCFLRSLFFITLLISKNSWGNQVSEHHIYMLHSGVDVIKGSYMFLVNNESSEAVKSQYALALPTQTIDWVPLQGLTPDDIKIQKEGGLVIEKEFAPGENLISLGFVVPAASGDATISLKMESFVKKVSIMIAQEHLSLASSSVELSSGKPMDFGGSPFKSYSLDSPKPMEIIDINLTGVYPGRTNFYWIGGGFAALLVFLSGLMFWRTRPKVVENFS